MIKSYNKLSDVYNISNDDKVIVEYIECDGQLDSWTNTDVANFVHVILSMEKLKTIRLTNYDLIAYPNNFLNQFSTTLDKEDKEKRKAFFKRIENIEFVKCNYFRKKELGGLGHHLNSSKNDPTCRLAFEGKGMNIFNYDALHGLLKCWEVSRDNRCIKLVLKDYWLQSTATLHRLKTKLGTSALRLSKLALVNCHLTDKDVESLVDPLAKGYPISGSLQVLNLSGNEIKDKKFITSILINKTSIREFDFSKNCFVYDDEHRCEIFYMCKKPYVQKISFGKEFEAFHGLSNHFISVQDGWNSHAQQLVYFGNEISPFQIDDKMNIQGYEDGLVNFETDEYLKDGGISSGLSATSWLLVDQYEKLLGGEDVSGLKAVKIQDWEVMVTVVSRSIESDYAKLTLGNFFERSMTIKQKVLAFFIEKSITLIPGMVADFLCGAGGIALAATGIGIPGTIALLAVDIAIRTLLSEVASTIAQGVLVGLGQIDDEKTKIQLEKTNKSIQIALGNHADVVTNRDRLIHKLLYGLSFLFQEHLEMVSPGRKKEVALFLFRAATTGQTDVELLTSKELGAPIGASIIDILLKAGVTYINMNGEKVIRSCLVYLPTELDRKYDTIPVYKYFTNSGLYKCLHFQSEMEAKQFMRFRRAMISAAVAKECNIFQRHIHFYWREEIT